MANFKDFLIETEEKENVQATIKKLPKGHQKLLKGYKFKFTGGNTLKGDSGHVGLIHKDKITVAAPWNYGREMVFIHEIAHLIWEFKMTPQLRQAWKSLFNRTKSAHKKALKKLGQNTSPVDQNAEEIFCMSYGAFYCKNTPMVFHCKEWMDFIKKLPE